MTSLVGLRVLVVEDEGLIAMMIEDMLEDMGCVVAASAATVSEALTCVEAGGFGFALLDMNLQGASADVVADALVKTGIPFALASGYGRAGAPAHLQARPVIAKPFTSVDLEKVLRDGLSAAHAPSLASA